MKISPYTSLRITLLTLILCSSCSHQFIYQTKNQYISLSSYQNTDTESDSIIAPYARTLSASMNEVIGYSEIDMLLLKEDDETLLGNWAADMVLDLVKTKTSFQPDGCMLNIGGLRTSIFKGPITRGQIFSLMPFENEIVVLELDTEAVSEMMFYLTHIKAQPISGFRFKAKRNGDIIEKNGPLFSSSLTHYVVTSDYLANGGDNMFFFTKAINRFDTDIKLRDAIIDYILQKKSINSSIDKRIAFIP